MLTKGQLQGIAAALIFLMCCTAAGALEREGRSPGWKSRTVNLSENSAGEEETAPPDHRIPVTETQEALLEELQKAMEAGDLEAVGRLMNQEEEILADLFYGSAKGMPCRYEDGALSSQLEGRGLALKGSGLCFYGTFAENGPEGFCRGVRASVLEGPRYDFAEGEWQNGQMNGPGKTGYRYYEGTEGEEVAEVLREGSFENDALNGQFIYESTNGKGETSRWTMKAEMGVLALDERWEYLEDRLEYRLPADDDETHVYVVLESRLEEPSWKNPLAWE